MRVGTVLAAVIGLFAVANLPSLRNGGFVDAGTRTRSGATAGLDRRRGTTWTSCQTATGCSSFPGSEFGAFRWGYTVDQPLPALTERALLTRDLLPLGSPAAMDLVFALDDRFQDGVVDIAAIAPIARLLGVDTIWVTDDVAFDRFRVARPEIVDDLLTGEAALDAGLLPAERFGEPTVMVPDVAMIDEQSLSDPRVGQPLATVSLVGVSDPVATVRVKDESVVVSGSADGLVDAAAAGVIDGSELVLYSASFEGDGADRPAGPVRTAGGHRLQPRPRPPLAQLAGRDRLHRGRRAPSPECCGTRAVTSGSPCSTPTIRRRRPCRSRTGRSPRRPARTGSRSPTSPNTAR